MATVYTHIGPFQKRAINYFRQCIAAIGERGKIGSALDELLRKQEFFHEFLASFGPGLKSVRRTYIEGCAAEVERGLAAVYLEREILESILRSLNPCPDCGGHGEFRIQVSMSEGHYEKCKACGGDGVEGGAIATYPARGVQ